MTDDTQYMSYSVSAHVLLPEKHQRGQVKINAVEHHQTTVEESFHLGYVLSRQSCQTK